MTEPTIGDRIRELRTPTYTQNDLAAAADVSVDVIRKLEQGRRLTASIPTLARIARALNVSITALLGPSSPALPGGDQAQVTAIRDALTSVDALLGELDDADAPDLTELGRTVTYAWGHFYAGRFGQLARLLPRLLADAQAATHAAMSSSAKAGSSMPSGSLSPLLSRCNSWGRSAPRSCRCTAGSCCAGPPPRPGRAGPARLLICSARPSRQRSGLEWIGLTMTLCSDRAMS